MLGWFWLQARLCPSWGLVLASSLSVSRDGRHQGWAADLVSSHHLGVGQLSSDDQEQGGERIERNPPGEIWELTSSVACWVGGEGDQAVDSKPGGRVVLPRLSININNPSHPTPHHTTPHHTTTQWTLSEKQPSLQSALSLIYDTASSSPCSA